MVTRFALGCTRDLFKNSKMLSKYLIFWASRLNLGLALASSLGLSFFVLSASHAQSQPTTFLEPAPMVQEMAFKDFFQMPFGPKGLAFTPKALALDGQWVSITGYMVKVEQAVPGEFILSPRPVEINDHADGDANDLPAHAIRVILDASQSATWVPHRSGLIQLKGRLSLGRQESATLQVSWIRLHLERDAVQVQSESTPLVSPLPAIAPLPLSPRA